MFSLPSLAPVEQKSKNLLHSACKEKDHCACSFQDTDFLTPKAGVCDDRHGGGSETSNIVSVCSSHDSSNENVESKAILRISDASEGMSVLSKVAISQTVAEEKFSKLSEVQKLSDSNGEDTSCISRAESPSIPEDHINGIDKKNASQSSDSVNSSLQVIKRTVGFQLTERNCQEKHCVSSQPTDFTQEASLLSGKSDPSEISSLREACVSSKKVKGHHPESSREEEELYSSRIAASNPGGGFDSAASAKPKSQVDEIPPATAKTKHLDQNASLSDDPNALRHREQSQTTASNDKEDVLIDVNVCDICGDAGREDLLAICSKCTDGAEHTYCMRVKLEEVPGDDWICEDCLLQEENNKQKHNAIGKVVRSSQASSSSNDISLSAAKPDAKIRTCMDTKVPNAGRNCQKKCGLLSRICGKRRMGSSEFNILKKRRTLETSLGSPRMTSPKKALLPGDSPHKDLDNAKGKPTSRPSSFDDHSLNRSQKDVLSSVTSLIKSPTRCQGSQGLFTKSKSFSISDRKPKAGVPDEVPSEKQEGTLDKVVCYTREHSSIRRMNKSWSLNKVSSGLVAPADAALNILSSNIPPCKDSIKAKPAIEKTSSPTKNNSKSEFNRKVAGSCTSASRSEKEIAAEGTTSFPCSPRTSFTKPVQTCGNQSISLELHNGPKSICNDQASSDVGNKMHPFLSKVIQNLSDLTSARTHEGKENAVSGNDHSRSSTPRLAGNQFNNYCSGGLPKSQGAINQSVKAQRTSYLSTAGNRSFHSHKNEIFPVESPQTLALNRANSEEAKLVTDKDCKAKSDQTAATGILAIPKFDYVWKGGFKINSVGKHPCFCWGIQAHLSTRSSPKVPEVVRKLPSAISLEEVSRTSVWPTQFLENCPNEDSIGVYFFAEDIVSYKGRYGNLMERMIGDDLALKGDVDGLDMLIFSSNLLPKKSQCWNNLYFLWALFRGRRIQNGAASKSLDVRKSSTLNDPQESPSIPRGRSHVDYLQPPSSCKENGDYLQTTLDSKESLSRLNDPRDKSCDLASLKENGFHSSRLEDSPSSNYLANSLPWNSGKAHSSNVSEEQCQFNDMVKVSEALLELGDMPEDEDNAQRLVVSSDCSMRDETEFVDLGLSLRIGKISGKPEPVTSADGRNSRSGDNAASVSVELSLGLPSYNA